MFHGFVIKGNARADFPESEGEVFHLSTVCLNDPKSAAKSTLYIHHQANKFAVCTLQKDKQEHANCDLFLAKHSNPTFSVEGPSELHVCGYFEPEESPDDIHFDTSDEEAEEAPDVLAQAKDVAKKIVNNRVLPMKLPSDAQASAASLSSKGMGAKNLGKPVVEEPEDDDDEDDDDDDEEASDDENVPVSADALPQVSDDSDEGDDDDEEGSDSDAVNDGPPAPPTLKSTKLEPGKGAQPSAAQKRKVETAAPASAPKKGKAGKPEAKKAGKAPTTPDEVYQQALVQFLTSNGRCPISTLGSKVKRPEGLKGKLNQFMKERPAIFKVEGMMAALAK